MSKKILLIDDEKEVVHIMRKHMQAAGYDAHVAYDGKQGLDAAQELHPHLVLTDIAMPTMDGIRFYQELRARQDIGHIPVIVVSAYGAHEDEMRSLGVKDYLIKPFNTQALLSKVSSFFETRKACRVFIATKMLFLTKVILDEAKEAVQHLDIHVTNDQGTVADEAIELRPDLLILDVDMFTAFSPEGTVRYLRSKEILKETQILLMRSINVDTSPESNTGQAAVERCLSAGASHYIGCLNKEAFEKIVADYCQGWSS